MKLKKIVAQLIRNMNLLVDYWRDYCIYKKYNFGNVYNKEKNALEAKIMRQAHILEKGMSLSSPKLGFGQEKINVLFKYLDEYIDNGLSQDSSVFQSALGSLDAYIKYFNERDYSNKSLEKRIKLYKNDKTVSEECGIEMINIDFINQAIKSEFPMFFLSRHSVRQFSTDKVEIDKIKQAIELAMHSPSACNRQSAKVYMSDCDEVNNKLGNLLEGNGGFETEVSKYLVVTGDCMRFTDSYERNQHIIDASLFAMSLVLSLHYFGIGSCILQASERNKMDKERRKLLRIPENEKIVLVIAVGYYKDKFSVAKSRRNPLEDYLVIR